MLYRKAYMYVLHFSRARSAGGPSGRSRLRLPLARLVFFAGLFGFLALLD